MLGPVNPDPRIRGHVTLRGCYAGVVVTLALACAAAWTISYWNITWLPFFPPEPFTIRLTRGLICVWTMPPPNGVAWHVDGYSGLETAWLARDLPWLALHTVYGRALHLPLWIPTLVFGVLGIRAGRATLLRLRWSRGQCAGCGYLLHGLSAPRCPECGVPFPDWVPCHPASTLDRTARIGGRTHSQHDHGGDDELAQATR